MVVMRTWVPKKIIEKSLYYPPPHESLTVTMGRAIVGANVGLVP